MADQRLTRFRYEAKVSKPKVTARIVTKSSKTVVDYTGLEDLNPSISTDLQVLFVGFNPGVESSKTQHHYAHYTNLFWKLFNQSEILFKVLRALDVDIESQRPNCELLRRIIVEGKSQAKPADDFDLIKYKIGFTDLVLRCTKSAQELTMQEKMDNVPRLMQEFKFSKSRNFVIIGKGIWEIIIKYIQKNYGIKVDTFQWGKQDNKYVDWMKEQMDHEFDLHVFPNTSGLVTAMNYAQKLKLWDQIQLLP